VTTPFDIIKTLVETKDRSVFEASPSSYVPYVINRSLSGSLETVLLANEMNQCHGLDVDQQYEYYFHTIRARRRYMKWLKPEPRPEIEGLKIKHRISTWEAKKLLPFLTDEARQFYATIAPPREGGLKKSL
jgi:hypothetical protein